MKCTHLACCLIGLFILQCKPHKDTQTTPQKTVTETEDEIASSSSLHDHARMAPRPVEYIEIASDAVRQGKQPVEIQQLKLEADILGHISKTTIHMTLYNPNSMLFAGDLSIPLPQGAWVNEYALDIDGKMVDGVPVPKQKARQVFEKEMNKRVDPGLVEHQQGNVFRTRVYPIPPNGVREIKISFLSQLVPHEDTLEYAFNSLPQTPIDRLELKVSVRGSKNTPNVNADWSDHLEFSKRGSSYMAEYFTADSSTAPPLRIAFKPVADQTIVKGTFQSPSPYVMASLGKLPAPSKMSTQRHKNVAVLFDASGSRAAADVEKEVTVLLAMLKQKLESTATLNLYSIRNTTTLLKSFKCSGGTCEGLKERIKSIPFDGGSNLNFGSRALRSQRPDAVFLLSDGLHDFDKLNHPRVTGPVFSICASGKKDMTYLRFLGAVSGGMALDVAAMSVKQAISLAKGGSQLSVISSKVSQGKITNITPMPGAAVGATVLVGGMLKSSTATVELCIGYSAAACKKVYVVFNEQDAHYLNDTHQLWAQSKLNDLLVFKDKNEAEILSLGNRHSIVTPGTSLMVLETYQQYLEHQIRPPKQLEEFRVRYDKEIAQQALQIAVEEDSKLKQMIEQYKSERVSWYGRTFPKSCKVEKAKKKNGSAPMVTRAGQTVGAADDLDMAMEAEAAPTEMLAASGPSAAPKRKMAEDKNGADGDALELPTAQIVIKEFDANSPYVSQLKEATDGKKEEVYYKLRDEFASSPSFYLDCSQYFFKIHNMAFGLQVLSNIAELDVGKAALLRVLAYRLRTNKYIKLAKWAFSKVKELRPEDPQSYRDLALIEEQLDNYQEAVELLTHVVATRWARFDGIEQTAILELNHCLQKAKHNGVKNIKVDKRLVIPMELDTRVVFTWDMDATDMDLWVIEPTQEKAYYSNRHTCIGGFVSQDFTQGFGPEEYLLKDAPQGTYDIKVKYFSDSAPSLTGAVNMMVDLYSDYGKKNETHKTISVYIKTAKDMVELGSFKVKNTGDRAQ